MFVSLYGNSIGNQELLNDLDAVYIDMLDSLNFMIHEDEPTEFQKKAERYSAFYNKAASISMKISEGININSV